MRLTLAALGLALLAACAERTEDRQVDMALACQLNKCVCAEPDRIFLAEKDPEPVLWKENGDAYCSEGFELKLAEE